LIYVVDIDLGLYVLRYTGKHAGEVAKAVFVEGNSAPSNYGGGRPVTGSRPRPTGPAGYVKAPYGDRVPTRAKYGFLCAL
ncbi:MAG TPA: hypothetical protein VNA20_17885, partial [Frankiaceae bacterium]|nr:hypothetical protein [Frankiaceae bacterium]